MHVLIFIFAFLLGFITIKLINRSRLVNLIVDKPNHRSLHVNPTPKTGGIGIATSIFSSTILLIGLSTTNFNILIPTLVAFLALLSLSLVDDARKLTVRARLPLHLTVIAAWTIGNLYLNSSPYLKQLTTITLIPLTIIVVLGMTWATNLFNFMDGSDGLAGGMSLVAFAVYGIAASQMHFESLSLFCTLTCGAICSFLYFNLPPAKIFLGDSGSIPIGFLASAMGAIGISEGVWGADFPLMVFAMFWVDATYTLVSRGLRGQKVTESHRDHWYQKAIQAGNSHQKVLLIHLICNCVIAALSLFSLKLPIETFPVARGFIICMVLAITIGFGIWAESQFKTFARNRLNNNS